MKRRIFSFLLYQVVFILCALGLALNGTNSHLALATDTPAKKKTMRIVTIGLMDQLLSGQVVNFPGFKMALNLNKKKKKKNGQN